MITTATPPTDAGTAYETVRPLIFDQIYKFKARFGGDLDELEGEANLAFMKGHTQYIGGTRPNGKPIENAYHVEIRRWVWFELFDAMRQRVDQKRRYGTPEAVGDLAYTFEDTCFDAVAFARHLDDDARTVLQLVLDPPICVVVKAERKGGEPRNIRSTVRAWLRSAGWHAARINDAFEEIRSAL